MGHKPAIEQALGQVAPPPRQAALALGVPDAAAVPAGKAGRPKGALNKRTEEFRRELLELGCQPGLAAGRLLAAFNRDPAAAAREYGCTMKDMVDKVLRAEELLLPYAEQKLPAALQIEGKGAVMLSIVSSPEVAAALAAEDPDGALTIEVNQGLSAPDPDDVGQGGVGQDASSD